MPNTTTTPTTASATQSANPQSTPQSTLQSNSLAGTELKVTAPATGELLATLKPTSHEEIHSAMASCQLAQKAWAQVSPGQRVKAVTRLRELIASDHDTLVNLIHQENGKPKFEALCAEVMPSLDFSKHFEKITPRLIKNKPIRLGTPLLPHRHSWIEYEPLGVIAIISPWNFPWLLPFCEVVIALLSGNGVILKPSEVTPLSGMKIQEYCERAGLPKGLVQVVIGDGTVGAELVRAKPAKIFFTGSVVTGKKVAVAAAAQLIPVNLELGGKDAMIVLEDADLELATSAALWGANFNLGQACASVERILVHVNIAERFSRKLINKIARLHTDDLGCVTFDKQKLVYDAHLNEAKAAGATILTGGSWSDDRKQLKPTIVAGAEIEKMSVYTDETFGPVAALTTFTTDDEAVFKANSSQYGLTASVFSQCLKRAKAVAGKIEAGTVTINEVLYTAGIPGTPWGGWKDSGLGRTHHDEGVLDFVQMRHIHAPRWNWVSKKSLWWFPYSYHQRLTFENLINFHGRGFAKKLRALAGATWHLMRMLLSEPRI